MPETGSYAERRVFPRYSLHLKGETEVLYRRAPDALREDPTGGGNHRYPIDLVNISMGGAMLTFEADFVADDTLRMFFRHPTTGKELSFEGHLVYVRRNATKLLGKYCAGMAFRNVSEKEGDLAEIIEYAASVGEPNADLK
jgi:hypothetical protein